MSYTLNLTTDDLGNSNLMVVLGLKGLGKFCSSAYTTGNAFSSFTPVTTSLVELLQYTYPFEATSNFKLKYPWNDTEGYT